MQSCFRSFSMVSRMHLSWNKLTRMERLRELAACTGNCGLRECRLESRYFSSLNYRYAAVDHTVAYEEAMNGPHGKQLGFGLSEGNKEDDPAFDPFDGDVSAETASLQQDTSATEGNEGVIYNPDGSVRLEKSALLSLQAGFPAGGQFAVIELGGSQHKVTTDDVLVANRLKPVEKFKIGSTHTISDVMLVGSSHKTLVGIPYVAGAEVDLFVEEITRDAKVVVFKKRRRKNSQRKNGYRRDVTLLRVVDIRMPDEFKNHSHVTRENLDSLSSAPQTHGNI